MADVLIPGVEGGEETNPAGTVTIEIDDGSSSKYSQLSNLHKGMTAFSGDSGSGGAKGIVPAPSAGDAAANKFLKSDGTWAAVTPPKGRVEFYAAVPPGTSGAPLNVLAGASTPAEQFPYYEFVNGSVTYRDFLCRLVGYNSGGLTLSFQVMRTSGSAAATYILEAAIRRINSASEDLGAAQTYDYNAVTVTIPAGPPNAGIPMAGTITFTDGADMDNLADGEFFFLRFRRNGGTATDTARVLAGIAIKET